MRLSVQQLLFLADVALDGPTWPRKTRYVDEYRTAKALKKKGLIQPAFRPIESRSVRALAGYEITAEGRKRLGLEDAT